MRRLITLGAACAALLVAAVPASAAPPVVASGPSPFLLEGLTTSGNVFQPFFVQALSRAAGNPSDVYFSTVPRPGTLGRGPPRRASSSPGVACIDVSGLKVREFISLRPLYGGVLLCFCA